MGNLNRAVLELTADIDGDAERETGVFEMVGNAEIHYAGQVDHFIASGQGSTINAVVSESVDSVGNLIGQPPSNAAKRRGVYLDLGGGAVTYEINFTGWRGSQDADVDHMQWGVPIDKPNLQSDHGQYYDDALSSIQNPYETAGKYDQSDGPPDAQIGLLQRFFEQGEYDSRAPHARLRVGPYNDGTFHDGGPGLFEDWIHVSVMRWDLNRVSEEPVAYSGSLRLAATRGWRDVLEQLAGKLP